MDPVVRTKIGLSEGEAVLATSQREWVVQAGQRADFTGGTLGEVVELIGFPRSLRPGVDARFRWRSGLSIGLRWRGVPGAVSYRVQIGRDLSFSSLVETKKTDRTGYDFAAKRDGIYVWRVASRDADGRYGEYGFARRIFCEMEKPRECLLAPEDGAVYGMAPVKVAMASVVASWESIAILPREATL